MKFFFLPALAVLLIFLACNSTKNNEKETGALLQTDKDFNTYCSLHGVNAAFLLYADSAVIESSEGELPLMGIEAVKKAQKSDTGLRLTWEPARGEVSGTLGYTFGWWKLFAKGKSGKDTTYFGDYVNVWKKQKDGSWKYLIDIGNDTPNPEGKK
jgi:ketosteroid isomerase-like protein